MVDSGKGGLVPPFAGKLNENASFRKHRKHGEKKRLKTPVKKSSSANEYEHESPTSVAEFFDSPSVQTPPLPKNMLRLILISRIRRSIVVIPVLSVSNFYFVK